MGKQVGIGLVGCGFIAFDAHFPSIAETPEAKLIAVASASAEHARTAAKKYGAKYWYTEYEKMLKNPEVEVVDICTLNFLHKDEAVAAFEAGKHVICIKPLARTLKEADEMLNSARKAGAKLMYAENDMFAPPLVRAKEIVDEGALGKIFRIHVSEGISRPHAKWFFDREKVGGGALIDMAIHSIGFTRWMVGTEVDRVYAELGTYVHKELMAEDNSVVVMKFKDGVVAVNEDSWSIPSCDSRFEVFGSEGVVLVDMIRSQPVLVYSEKGYGYVSEKVALAKGWTFPIAGQGYRVYGHLDMMKHFIECIAEDKKPISDGQVGRAALEVVQAAYESARTQAVVKLPLKP